MNDYRSPFAFRGVTEGFYGVYYTTEERNDLIQFLGANGYNFYMYGPKNDRQHRMRWREPYPDYIMNDFAETVRVAQEAGVEFCWSIGSGVSMSYASEDDFAAVMAKFRAFFAIGVRAFSITLDDIASEFKHEADRVRYRSFAEAHADVTNRLYAELKGLDERCTLSLCPTDYHGVAPFSAYIMELGEKLHSDIDLFYTGPEICSPVITAEQAAAFAAAVRRKPILWDNYPVNDLDMRGELHIGPIRGRDGALAGEIKGFLINLMVQAEASKVPLLTWASYIADPAGYDPDLAWREALRQVGGASWEELLRFAEHSLKSCLGEEESARLRELTDAALVRLKAGASSDDPAVLAFDAFVTSLDEACYHLKNRLRNTALRNNLLPWIEVLEHYHWMTKRALLVIAAVRSSEAFTGPLAMMRESRDELARHAKRMGGEPLLAVADYAESLVAGRERESGSA